MHIGIVDADLLDGGTRHPNLALMKISGYHKNPKTICAAYQVMLVFEKAHPDIAKSTLIYDLMKETNKAVLPFLNFLTPFI